MYNSVLFKKKLLVNTLTGSAKLNFSESQQIPSYSSPRGHESASALQLLSLTGSFAARWSHFVETTIISFFTG